LHQTTEVCGDPSGIKVVRAATLGQFTRFKKESGIRLLKGGATIREKGESRNKAPKRSLEARTSIQLELATEAKSMMISPDCSELSAKTEIINCPGSDASAMYAPSLTL
jgi:hypothetical protein